MRLELLARTVLLVQDLEPVVGRRKRVPVHRAVPSRARRADLLHELAVAVEDVDRRLWLARKADDVPRIVVPVRIRREVVRVVDHRYRHRLGVLASAVVPVPHVHDVVASRNRREHVALLPWALVKLVLVVAKARRVHHYRDGRVVREGVGHRNVRDDRRRGRRDDRSVRWIRYAARGDVRGSHRIASLLVHHKGASRIGQHAAVSGPHVGIVSRIRSIVRNRS
ncbi:hypothetical protein D3C86_926020 [compost metagenome]